MTVHVLPDIGQAPTFQGRLKDRDEIVVDRLRFVLKCYPQDALVNNRTDEGYGIFMIHSGWGCLCSGLPDGDRQIVDFPLKNDIVLLPSGADADEQLTALTDLLVFEAYVETLSEAIADSPSLGPALLAAAGRQRTILAQHLTSIGRRRALIRVAYLLLEFAVRLEKTGEATNEGYRFPLTQYDLADALGLTAIHVNRMLRVLREREYVEFRQGSVRFLNREGLERFAGFNDFYLR